MGWVTVDRAVDLATRFSREALPEWAELRDQIADEVRHKGWKDRRPVVHRGLRRYRSRRGDSAHRTVGADRSDGSALCCNRRSHRGRTTQRLNGIPLPSRRRPARHRRWIPSLCRLARRGIPTDRGNACKQRRCSTSWSRQRVPPDCSRRSTDPIAERSLGNHPQAYSHLGLLRCAQLLRRERYPLIRPEVRPASSSVSSISTIGTPRSGRATSGAHRHAGPSLPGAGAPLSVIHAAPRRRRRIR